jgi:DNA replication protein DnaC
MSTERKEFSDSLDSSSVEESRNYKEHVKGFALERFMRLSLGSPEAINPRAGLLPTHPWHNPLECLKMAKNLVVCGPVGCGKTDLMKLITWTLCLNKKKPRGGFIPSMNQKLKTSNSESYIEDLLGGDFLVFDDFDKLRGTPYELEKYLMLVNEYYCNGKSILVTMNKDPDEMLESLVSKGCDQDYVESILSRMTNKKSTIKVDFTGISNFREVS